MPSDDQEELLGLRAAWGGARGQGLYPGGHLDTFIYLGTSSRGSSNLMFAPQIFPFVRYSLTLELSCLRASLLLFMLQAHLCTHTRVCTCTQHTVLHTQCTHHAHTCTHTASQGLPLGVGIGKDEAHSLVQVLGPLRVVVCFQEHTQKSFGTHWCQEACPLWAWHLVQHRGLPDLSCPAQRGLCGPGSIHTRPCLGGRCFQKSCHWFSGLQ